MQVPTSPLLSSSPLPPSYLENPSPKDPQFFNNWWQGENYSKNSTAQFALALEMLEKAYSFQGNETLIDIGCGSGEIATILAQSAVPQGQVYGIDLSANMIAEASKKSQAVSNVYFKEGDAQAFNIFSLSGPADIIISTSALHWVPNQKAVWERIREHLRIEGCALISLNPPPRQQELTLAIETCIQDPRWKPFFEDFKEKAIMPEMTIEQYQDIILSTGMRIETAQHSMRQSPFANQEAFANSLQAWLPHIARIPAEQQKMFANAVAENFLAYTAQDPAKEVKLSYNHFWIKAFRSH